MWPRQIPLQITVFAERLRNAWNTSQRLLNKNSSTWWYVLKKSWRYFSKTSRRCLEDVLARCLEDVLARCLEGAFTTSLVLIKTSWRRLLKTKKKDVFNTSLRRLHQDECLLGLSFFKVTNLIPKFFCFFLKRTSLCRLSLSIFF